MAVSNTKSVVILGKTGAGKSSLANTISGGELFPISDTPNSDISGCQAKTESVNGRRITLIDTPGFFDTKRSEEEMKAEIVSCMTKCSPGPHAFIIVLKVERYTEQEQAVIDKIKQYFSEEVFKYTTVLFTHGDQLREGQTIMDFVNQNRSLNYLVEKCGGRCHVIDNKYWKNDQQDEYRRNKFQVEELLKTIDKITEANRGGCYTNEMLQTWEEAIQQEEELIRLSSPNMSVVEIREQAEISTSKKMLIRLAGFTTGVLLGAMCGVGVSVGIVLIALLKVVKPLRKIIKVAKKAIKARAPIAPTKGESEGQGKAKVTTTTTTTIGGESGEATEKEIIRITGGEATVKEIRITGGEATEKEINRTIGGESGGEVTPPPPPPAGGAGRVTVRTVLTTLKVAAAVSAAVGAVIGGVTGYQAAEDAETVLEGAGKAAETVLDGAFSVVDKADDFMDRLKKRVTLENGEDNLPLKSHIYQ